MTLHRVPRTRPDSSCGDAGWCERRIPIALAGILDCTNWNMPDGGWKIPVTVGAYRFFFQSGFPGGGRGAVAKNNQEAQLHSCFCGGRSRRAGMGEGRGDADRRCCCEKGHKVFRAPLIRGLTVGINLLSPLEKIQAILQRLGIECQIASAGLFAHEFYSANLRTLVDKYRAGSQIMAIGHSTGGNEAAKIAAALAVLEAGEDASHAILDPVS